MTSSPKYPLPRPSDAYLLTGAAAQVTREALAELGFPAVTDPDDMRRLQEFLDHFLFGPNPRAGVHVSMRSTVVERGANVTGVVINGSL